ncbi:MAG: hypothetical protein M1497_10190 [Nitrospirae bacterium]|nr:hypothetical protein [Nitrospirota bacterium]
MKATVQLTIKTASVPEAQRLLRTLCEGLVASGSIEEYRFEIDTAEGAVTEKCLLSEEGRVVA